MNITRYQLVLCVLVGGLILACGDRDELPSDAMSFSEASVRGDGAQIGSSGLLDWEWGLVSWREPDFKQDYSVHLPAELAVRDREYDQLSGEWSERYYSGFSSFGMRHAAASGRDMFCVEGVARSGDAVIEVWYLMSVGGTGGGQSKSFVRSEIYRGSLSGGQIVSLDFDAESRFVVALVHGPGELCYVSVFPVDGGAPVVLANSGSYPELCVMANVQKFDHQVLGRIWVLTPSPGGAEWTNVIFVDSNNDGVFDGPPLVATQEELEVNGLSSVELWDPLHGPE